MKSTSLTVLYEDNHLLVVSKPAGLPTMGTPSGVTTLLDVAKEYIKKRYEKPGNVYLGIVSRLDAPVTGVVLLARTSKAAKRLTEQFRNRSVEKTYWAIVEGVVEPVSGECVDWVGQDKRHRRMWVVGKSIDGAKEARLKYKRIELFGDASLLEVELQTGRKHQIRLQLADRGYAILGDRKYGSVRKWAAGIALHARNLTITHPVSGEKMAFEAPLPDAWRNSERFK